MGEYIRTGIIAKFTIYKSEAGKIDINQAKIRKDLAAAVVDNPASFDCVDGDDRLIWTLKQGSVDKRLSVFLDRYFKDFYPGDSDNYDSDCKPILDYLSKGPSVNELYDWQEDSDYDIMFYDDEKYIYVAQTKVRANLYIMGLTSEGKVMYEELDRHLAFFGSAMRRAYADDPLGGGLVVTVGW